MAATEPRVKTETTKLTKASSPRGPELQRLRKVQRTSILLKHGSDPTRVQILLLLIEGERHVGSLGEELSMSQPAISHHLALLRHGGIIAPRRQGKNNYYVLTDVGHELANVIRTMIG